jgi:hypothetical protein
MVEIRGSRWTPQEDALLRRMAEANVRPDIIAVKLNRTVHAVTYGVPRSSLLFRKIKLSI